MILILSEYEDTNTDEVCWWLNYYKVDFLRLNDGDNSYHIDVYITNENKHHIIRVNNRNIPLSDFSTVWFRRGYFCTSINKTNVCCFKSKTYNDKVSDLISTYLNREFAVFTDYLYSILKSTAKCINYPALYNINKLIVLEYASDIGLKIPKTLVTSQKRIVDDFIKDKNLITKNISDWYSTKIGNLGLSMFPQKLTNINNLNINTFFYSLFQEQIEPLFEIRTFVWDNKTYSASILNDDSIEENRICPCKLPLDVESKLLELMTKIGIESGSADFIIDRNLNYWFLEINPVGQFDFVDKHCNYNISKIIAQTLIYNENHK
ncbi:MAG: hypothetical protein Q4A56_02315 [Porphyromonadaceae bacterium]|nr:hypothetical protein [Porphyromonadaceae bacterium]